jgi:hypothetical protein
MHCACRKSQATAEYAIMISLVVAAAMGIQNEVRRSIQARVHQETAKLSSGEYYEPSMSVKTTTNQRSQRVRDEGFTDGESNQPWMTIKETSSQDFKIIKTD